MLQPARALIYWRRWLAGGMLLLLTVLFLALVPLTPPSANLGVSDKVLHLLGFMGLMLWFGGLVKAESRGWVFFALLLYGGAIEVLQSMTGYRSMEFADFVADAAGLLLGWQLTRRGFSEWCHWVEQWLKD